MDEIRKAGDPRTVVVDGEVDAPQERSERDGPLAGLLDAAHPRAGADHVTVHSGDGLFRASIPLAELRRGAIVAGRVQVPDAPTNCWNVKDVRRLEVTVGPRPDSITEKAARREASGRVVGGRDGALGPDPHDPDDPEALTVDLRIFTEPQQGATYDTLLAHARKTEALGFDAWFRSDHYLHMGDGADGDGLPGPTDAWITLAGLARETERVRLGTLVTSATFRHPGPLAIAVAQVDAMSGGRVELGLGAGWFDDEHRAYGIPFPPTKDRFDRLEHQLEIVRGLWGVPAGERWDRDDPVWPVAGSPGLPKPTQQPRPPIVVGGWGTARTPALAARFADEFNVPFAPVDAVRPMFERVRAACDTAGRDPATMRWSVAMQTVVGADDAAYERRVAAIGRDPVEQRAQGLSGTVTEAVDRLRAFAAAGCERAYLQVLDLDDHDHLELLAAELLPVAAEL